MIVPGSSRPQTFFSAPAAWRAQQRPRLDVAELELARHREHGAPRELSRSMRRALVRGAGTSNTPTKLNAAAAENDPSELARAAVKQVALQREADRPGHARVRSVRRPRDARRAAKEPVSLSLGQEIVRHSERVRAG